MIIRCHFGDTALAHGSMVIINLATLIMDMIITCNSSWLLNNAHYWTVSSRDPDNLLHLHHNRNDAYFGSTFQHACSQYWQEAGNAPDY